MEGDKARAYIWLLPCWSLYYSHVLSPKLHIVLYQTSGDSPKCPHSNCYYQSSCCSVVYNDSFSIYHKISYFLKDILNQISLRSPSCLGSTDAEQNFNRKSSKIHWAKVWFKEIKHNPLDKISFQYVGENLS